MSYYGGYYGRRRVCNVSGKQVQQQRYYSRSSPRVDKWQPGSYSLLAATDCPPVSRHPEGTGSIKRINKYALGRGLFRVSLLMSLLEPGKSESENKIINSTAYSSSWAQPAIDIKVS